MSDFLDETISRRSFLHLMSASAALAGVTACTKMPPEKIIPYVVAPEELIPSRADFYATGIPFAGYLRGALAESHEGRPTKLEGNPQHPETLGKSDVFLQAELLSLYDPDRAQAVFHLGEPKGWNDFALALVHERELWGKSAPGSVRILTGRVTSPTTQRLIARFQKTVPGARWHSYEPVSNELALDATRLAFGRELEIHHDFATADVIVSVDADFLGSGAGQISSSRAFMTRRRAISQDGNASKKSNRLYVVEPGISVTGAVADHRWPVKASELLIWIRELASRVGVAGFPSTSLTTRPGIGAIAEDLLSSRGRSLVIVGEQCPSEVQAIAFAVNEHLGNLGATVRYAPREDKTSGWNGLAELIHDINEGGVDTLFVAGCNPVYASPSAMGFADAFRKVRFRVSFGLYRDETSYLCHWNLPESHALESWGDGRSWDGTTTLQQPLITPLYHSKSTIEFLSILMGDAGASARDLVRATHSLNEHQFEEALKKGFVGLSREPESILKVKPDFLSHAPLQESAAGALEAVFKPDPTVWDGCYANHAWLQELPKPILQNAWDNVIAISKGTARKHRLEIEDEVEIKIQGRTEKGSVLIAPGIADDTIVLYLGYGRTRAGQIGNGHGYNAYALMDPSSPWHVTGVELKATGFKAPLALCHDHHRMENREPVIQKTFDDFKVEQETEPTLLTDYSYDDQAWAMVIDLSVCIGCKTCTIACQAENNIPIVGKEQVRRSREMHWIRVDAYFAGDESNPQISFEPVPCMHCETAPCEEVCPTVATNHSSDGLNQMVYNRCVGTRYCSNNCPYKVRRFNFLQYSDFKTKVHQLSYNPDVTVRSRGVMEKCTYCIQRIQSVRIEAEKEDRPIRDLEILTACQQACPTDAIVFGDRNDKRSKVTALEKRPQNYKLLNDLGTKPRTTYLALLKNPKSGGAS